MPPNHPSKRVALPRAAWRCAPCKYPHFSRKILNPPPRNEILDTPLHGTIYTSYYIHKILYTQGTIYTSYYIHKILYTQGTIYTSYYIHKILYTQGTVYTNYYIHKILYTQGTIYTRYYIHKILYTQNTIYTKYYRGPIHKIPYICIFLQILTA